MVEMQTTVDFLGLVVNGPFVSATDTVTLQLANQSASPIDPAAADFIFYVKKYTES